MVTEILGGRYELGAELGAGGMARVCEAYDRTLARRVAVKLLHAQVMSQPGMRDRFLQEARSAASFSHPHAVAVYDTGREGDVPYIVMELVEGRSLADILAEREALTPRQAIAVASQILSALGSAHRRGLVHRDVKPANVLLPGGQLPDHPNGDPPAKLADFGIAKGLEEAASGLTATGQVLGTPKYVSPEQVSGAAATPRSDVYSAGVMLYEMLAGKPPFHGDSAIALAMAHREDPVPRLDRKVRGLDPDIAAVVHRALEKNPADRFADASEMRAALADPAGAAAGAIGPMASTAVMDHGATTQVLDSGRDADEEFSRRAPWGPIALVAVLALALLTIVAVDWGGLVDRLTGPAVEEDAPEEDPPAEGPDDDPDDTEPDDTEPDDTEPGDEPGDDADPGDDTDDPPPGSDTGEGDPPADPDPPAGEDDPPADPDPPAGDGDGDGEGDTSEGEQEADPDGDVDSGTDGNPSAGNERRDATPGDNDDQPETEGESDSDADADSEPAPEDEPTSDTRRAQLINAITGS